MNYYLHISNIFPNFGAWIGGNCKPSDKGMLTAFPRFYNCQHNVNKNVSNMLKFEELPKVNSERWLSLENLEGEEWRTVDGYEGIEGRLLISNYGRLKGVAYIGYHPICKAVKHKERIYRLQKTQYGYWQKSLEMNGGFYNFLIHRLVAKAFIPNPDNLPFINHKDENPKNACVYNLEWCTPQYNAVYGTATERRVKAMKENGTIRSVIRYDYEGNVLEKFESISDAERRYKTRGLIELCCVGKIATAKGMHFRFKEEKYVKREIKNNKYFCTLINSDGTTYSSTSIIDFCRKIGVGHWVIRGLMKKENKYSKLLYNKNIILEDAKGVIIVIENGQLKTQL